MDEMQSVSAVGAIKHTPTDCKSSDIIGRGGKKQLGLHNSNINNIYWIMSRGGFCCLINQTAILAFEISAQEHGGVTMPPSRSNPGCHDHRKSGRAVTQILRSHS